MRDRLTRVVNEVNLQLYFKINQFQPFVRILFKEIRDRKNEKLSMNTEYVLARRILSRELFNLEIKWLLGKDIKESNLSITITPTLSLEDFKKLLQKTDDQMKHTTIIKYKEEGLSNLIDFFSEPSLDMERICALWQGDVDIKFNITEDYKSAKEEIISKFIQMKQKAREIVLKELREIRLRRSNVTNGSN